MYQEPPEKRPSVNMATLSPRPAPMIADVGVNISGMPGPPFGPSYRMMITLPLNDLESAEEIPIGQKCKTRDPMTDVRTHRLRGPSAFALLDQTL
jgi:hypothetical protein